MCLKRLNLCLFLDQLRMMLLHVFLFIITVERFIAESTSYFLSLGGKASLIPVRHLFICFDVENIVMINGNNLYSNMVRTRKSFGKE